MPFRPQGQVKDTLRRRGDGDEAVAAQLTDKKLLRQYRQVELLNKEDKHLVKTFIDAFITKRQIQQLAQ